MSLLQNIVNQKHADVAQRTRRLPLHILNTLLAHASPLRSFKKALETAPSAAVIAEVKRASPSRGVLKPLPKGTMWHPQALAQAYEAGGARCLSVLTDTPSFWGCDDVLEACKSATQLPVLRKDFIVDPYQIVESRWLGADCILLIARILTPVQICEFSAQAMDLGMDVLIEVHNAQELQHAVKAPNAILGINNRDLDTLTIDVRHALQLKSQIAPDRHVVAESGIQSADVVQEYMNHDVRSFLIGEYLACHADPTQALKGLIP